MKKFYWVILTGCFLLLYLLGIIASYIAYWIFNGTYEDVYYWGHELTQTHIVLLIFGVIFVILAVFCFASPVIVYIINKEGGLVDG